MKRAAILVIALIAVSAGLWAGADKMMSRASRVQATYSQDNGYFYRLIANFTVKETGEELNFDYVAACNIRVTRWRDGGLSDDSTFSPRVLVKATSAGHAVMLKTLNECAGLTSENGNLPPDLMPIAIWFDSVDDLSVGLAYVSEDAYDNPIAKLAFRGARVDRATRAEWEAWRKQTADEYVQQGALPGPWGYDYFGRAKIANQCDGYSRLKLPEVIRPNVRQWWPAARPRFWAPPEEEGTKVNAILNDNRVTSPPGVTGWIRRFGNPGIGDGSGYSGVPLRSGLSAGLAPHLPTRWPAETYPFLWPPLASAYPIQSIAPSQTIGVYAQKIEFRDGALNGFAACQTSEDAFGRTILNSDPAAKTKRHVFMVDDQVVRQVDRDIGSLTLQAGFVFERDEYVFIRFGVGL